MSDWGAGFAIGVIVGWIIGFTATRGRQRRWAEMSQREKRVRIGLVAAGVLLLLAGIIVYFALN